ncbi:MAG: hypothetical protein ACOCVV_11330, partial [Marinobacter sp.]
MSRSVRASLFLMVAPFAVTFTLVAWVVESKIGPWLDQPLLADCAERGYPGWFCSLQDNLFTWLTLGLGIMVLLTVTALLSISLFRAQIRELQQSVMDFQKGHHGQLPADVPREVAPLVQLLNRILRSVTTDPAGATSDRTPHAPPPPRSKAPRPDEIVTDRRPARPVTGRPPTPPPARDRANRAESAPRRRPYPMEVMANPGRGPGRENVEV